MQVGTMFQCQAGAGLQVLSGWGCPSWSECSWLREDSVGGSFFLLNSQAAARME